MHIKDIWQAFEKHINKVDMKPYIVKNLKLPFLKAE